jgi:formylmethanofuran dehydrogenase subunit B
VSHDLIELAERMKSCRCGVVFFGLGLTASELNRSPRDAGLGHLNVEVLLRLVAELNDHTRFHARRMRLHGDVTGADSVLCWQTGYPFSVNLSRGYPRYNPGEFSANDLLIRGEPDVCVVIGSETLSQFTKNALDHLRRIPTIVLDYPATDPIITPTVRITAAPYGLHATGTAYRMDEVPIPLRASLPAQWPTDETVLEEIVARLKQSAQE